MFRRGCRRLGLVVVLTVLVGHTRAEAARIAVARVRNMCFGTVTRDVGTSGWVRVSPAGVVTRGGAVIFLGGTTGAAEFEVSGKPDAAFTIWLPRRVRLGTGVKVKRLVSEPAGLGRLGPDGRATVRVGGVLRLGKGATTGALSAPFRVRVKYL